MEIIAFILIGIVTGIGSVFLLFRFDGSWIKAFSLNGGAAILIAEFVAFSEMLGITSENKSQAFVSLLGGWLLTFSFLLPLILRSLKKQETRYRIQTWEILFGDKKAIDDYYQSKNSEITKILEEEYNVSSLKLEREYINRERDKLELEKKSLQNIIDTSEKILDKKHKIDIPVGFKFPVTSDFFELLPRYIQSISEFSHHISSFTDTFINNIKARKEQLDDNTILKTYLTSINYYIGQFLFDWRDVRVHFRLLNCNTNCYEQYVTSFKSGEEYEEELTPIPADNGLIELATKTKRSIVYSANRDRAYNTGSTHIWKDYISMVFEKLHMNGKPVLSLGISVKHHVDHKDMLYFLSYIQIEQLIQENLMKIDENFSVTNAVLLEVA